MQKTKRNQPSKKIIFTDHTDPILTTYLKEISKYKVISAEETLDLVKKAQNNDIEARDLIIKSNLRFVVFMAKQWQNRGVPLMDLISEGVMGLAYSIPKFDPNKGVPFISYAAQWIKQFIYQAIYWTGKEIRLPVSQQVKIVQIVKAESEFFKKHSRRPSSKELHDLTDISENDINLLAQFANKLISVDDFLGGDPDNNQVCDIIPDNNEDIDTIVDRSFLQEELIKVLSHLTIREHDVICLLFGIGRDPMESKEVGDLFGIGTERVRQIKEGALCKLRKKFGDKLRNLL